MSSKDCVNGLVRRLVLLKGGRNSTSVASRRLKIIRGIPQRGLWDSSLLYTRCFWQLLGEQCLPPFSPAGCALSPDPKTVKEIWTPQLDPKQIFPPFSKSQALLYSNRKNNTAHKTKVNSNNGI